MCKMRKTNYALLLCGGFADFQKMTKTKTFSNEATMPKRNLLHLVGHDVKYTRRCGMELRMRAQTEQNDFPNASASRLQK